MSVIDCTGMRSLGDLLEERAEAHPDKAFIVLAEPNALTEEDIKVYCASHLARFKVPTSIEIRDALPKLSSGKIQKSALKQATGSLPQS